MSFNNENKSQLCHNLTIFMSLCRGEEVIAAASMNFDPAVSRVAEVMASGKTITKLEAE